MINRRNREMKSKTKACALVGLVVTVAVLLASGSGVWGDPPKPFVPDGNMKRSAVPDRYKWNLDQLFKNDKAFERGLKQAAKKRKALGRFKGKLADPARLAACLKLYFETRLLTNQLTLYANLRHDTQNKSARLKGMSERSLQAMNALMSQAGFIRRQVLALDDAAMAAAYAKAAGLSRYKPYLDQVRRRRKRVFGPRVERVLSLAGDNLWAEIDLNEIPSDHEKSFAAIRSELPLPKIRDAKDRLVQLTLSNLGKYRASKVRRVRREALGGFLKATKKFQRTYAAALAGQVRFNVFLARSRGYKTALDAYLNKDDIDPAVYRSLIRTVGANLKPLHRYLRLRKRAMGLKKLYIHDLYAPLVKRVEMKYAFARAQTVLPLALAPLGPDYLKVLRRGLNPAQGWIDLYPSKHKDSGAFSASLFGKHPYVKMNYYDRLDDLSTLAHELGHAIHSHLSMTHQPYVTSNYASFIAEIASTFNEKLLSDHLLAHARTDAEKLYILAELAETIRTTIYRQTLFAEFELAVHTAAENGVPLTAKLLNKTYAKLIRRYYGKGFTMGPNDDVEWAYIPHFYWKYYVFTYATGLSAGIALAERVQKGGKKARDAYLGMLKGGSSKPPLELLRGAGVDLTRPHAFRTAARLLDRTVARMEKLLPKKR